MSIDRLFLHRNIILRRALQLGLMAAMLILAVASAWPSAQPAHLLGRISPAAPWWVAGILAALAPVVLFVWELRAVERDYGLTLLPPGWGTLRPRRTEGTARFLSMLEFTTRFSWRPGGILLGAPLREHQIFGLFSSVKVGPVDDRHVLTIAGSRAGKGTAALIPNLLTYPGSALVLDPKGELAQITAARRGHGSKRVRRALGQNVHILDPEDIVRDKKKACWNPLDELDRNDPHLYGAIAQIAFALVPPPPTQGDMSYFVSQARDLLTALIMHVLEVEPATKQNLIYIRELSRQGDNDLFQMIERECARTGVANPYSDPLDALLNFMASDPGKYRPEHAGKICGVAQRVATMAEQERSGVINQLSEQLSFLDHYAMEKTLQRSDFKLSDLKTEPTTIYICLKGGSLAGPLAKIAYIIVNMALNAMESTPGKTGSNGHKILFALDEFYSLGRSEKMDQAMGYIAGFGVTLWPILQHIGQLKRYYPDTWENFIYNCGAVQLFGDLSPETLEWVEKKIGDEVFRKPDGTLDRRPLLTRNELSSSYFERSERRQLVFFQQQPAAKLQLRDYFKYMDDNLWEPDPR